MPHISNKPTPKLRKAPQPPLSDPGSAADSDRAKKPPLVEPHAADQELIPGDRVEGLGDFGIPTGEFGTVRQANEDDALVKWDDDGRIRVHDDTDVILFIVEGKREVTFGARKEIANKHDAIPVTAGRLHNLGNVNRHDLKLFAVFSPPPSSAKAGVHRIGAEANSNSGMRGNNSC